MMRGKNILIGIPIILLLAGGLTSDYSNKVFAQSFSDIFEQDSETFNDKVFNDILKSYPELNTEGYKKIEATSSDKGLPSMLKVGANNEEIQNLIDIGWEKDNDTFGEKWLFLKDREGLFMYKKTDGSNVIRTIKKEGNIWILENEQTRKGSKPIWKETK